MFGIRWERNKDPKKKGKPKASSKKKQGKAPKRAAEAHTHAPQAQEKSSKPADVYVPKKTPVRPQKRKQELTPDKIVEKWKGQKKQE